MTDRVSIAFKLDHEIEIEPVIDECLEVGLFPGGEVENEPVIRYKIDGDQSREKTSLESVLERMVETDWERSLIELRYGDEVPLTFTFFKIGDSVPHSDWKLSIGIQSLFFNTSSQAEEDVEERVELLIELVQRLVDVVNPTFVSGGIIPPEMYEQYRPSGYPVGKHIEKLGWLTVLSKKVARDLGGCEHVLNAPAWKIEELPTGHIMIVKENNPDPAYATEGPSVYPDEYLLEGKDK